MRVPASAAPPELRKGAPWLKTTLVQCARAAARKKASYFQAQYHRLRARRGDKKAIGAVAASILTTAYHMLKYGTLYEDLGPDYFDKRGKGKHVHRLINRLQNLGFAVQITLWRLPPDVLTNLQPSYWTRRSSHGPPDGGPAGAVPPAGFVLGLPPEHLETYGGALTGKPLSLPAAMRILRPAARDADRKSVV